MTKAPEADPDRMDLRRVHRRLTHDVYRKGEGPGVVLIPEMPGLTPQGAGLGKPSGGQRLHRQGALAVRCPGQPAGPECRQRHGLWRANSRTPLPTSSDRGTFSPGRWPATSTRHPGQWRCYRRMLHRWVRAGGRCRRQRAGAGAEPADAALAADSRAPSRSRCSRGRAGGSSRDARSRRVCGALACVSVEIDWCRGATVQDASGPTRGWTFVSSRSIRDPAIPSSFARRRTRCSPRRSARRTASRPTRRASGWWSSRERLAG